MRSPAGGHQWRPINGGGADMVPLAHSNGRREPRMLTSDLALRTDPAYDAISRRFKDDPEAFADAFARAWFKLTHRDMGPIDRYLGPEVPTEELIWQDPRARRRPRADRRGRRGGAEGADPESRPHGRRSSSRRRGLRHPRSAAATSAAASTAPASASRRRRTGRSTTPPSSRRCSRSSSRSRRRSTTAAPTARRCRSPTSSCSPATRRSRRPLRAAGVEAEVVFHPGRTDATQEQTDVESFALPRADHRRVPQLLRAAGVLPDGAPPHRPGEPAHAERSGADGARRRPARARCELGRLGLRRLHRPHGRAHERLLREPARPRHDVEAARPRVRTRSRAPRTARASPSASARASTCCSARTPSCARSPRCTPRTTRTRSSCATS